MAEDPRKCCVECKVNNAGSSTSQSQVIRLLRSGMCSKQALHQLKINVRNGLKMLGLRHIFCNSYISSCAFTSSQTSKKTMFKNDSSCVCSTTCFLLAPSCDTCYKNMAHIREWGRKSAPSSTNMISAWVTSRRSSSAVVVVEQWSQQLPWSHATSWLHLLPFSNVTETPSSRTYIMSLACYLCYSRPNVHYVHWPTDFTSKNSCPVLSIVKIQDSEACMYMMWSLLWCKGFLLLLLFAMLLFYHSELFHLATCESKLDIDWFKSALMRVKEVVRQETRLKILHVHCLKPRSCDIHHSRRRVGTV